MNERIVVAKFGGTSVADAAQFRKIREIVQSGPERRFIVVSAPGKRFPEDRKVTDLLLDCYEKAAAGESYEEEFRQIRARFREIIDGLRISFPLDEELETLKQSLDTDPTILLPAEGNISLPGSWQNISVLLSLTLHGVYVLTKTDS